MHGKQKTCVYMLLSYVRDVECTTIDFASFDLNHISYAINPMIQGHALNRLFRPKTSVRKVLSHSQAHKTPGSKACACVCVLACVCTCMFKVCSL